MKIGIVTQPLVANYGGVLQNWALQQILKQLGHTPLTIDYIPHLSRVHYLLSTCKTLLLWFLPKHRRPFVRYTQPKRNKILDDFVSRHINTTRQVHRYDILLVKEYGLEALVVGSDQVWRPRYNRCLRAMFLHFARRCNVRKIVYAASFGVGANEWEYSAAQTRTCRQLARQFEAVSVRERSGIELCRHYLGIVACHLLDPTLLLIHTDYEALCQHIPRHLEAFVAVYLLDRTPQVMDYIKQLITETGLPVRLFSADKDFSLSVEEWLTMFRDASYVITDSFHGTVFAILFEKQFVTIANRARGFERFQSLLSEAGLEDRLITDVAAPVDSALLYWPVDWQPIRAQLGRLRTEAAEFLKSNLT